MGNTMDSRENMESEWMGEMGTKSRAIRLVRDILGCTCPEEVFNHYQVHYCTAGFGPFVQMIMGERLLVRLVNTSRLHSLEEEVPGMLSEGLAEREKRGLHRFRLVLVGNTLPETGSILMKLPEELGPRVHLHMIEPESIGH